MRFCKKKANRLLVCQRQQAQPALCKIEMLLNGHTVTVCKPGEFRVITKALACRTLDGGQAGNVILCGWAECHFHGGKYSGICLRLMVSRIADGLAYKEDISQRPEGRNASADDQRQAE